ncbi:MAG TPA: GNAT family N-acetyltransferase [Steroidobacteraceae bacterium]|nr:GNAT family N-acetyltransferase [Steroidobacteraceae bacterium]
MNVTVRPARASDTSECARICYQAFDTIARAHNFPPDFPDAEVAAGLTAMLLAHQGVNALVAELDGKVVGSNFVDERGAIWGLGPVTVDPAVQNHGVGEQLMRAALARAEQRRPAGVRLVQAGYHCRSLALYSKLGFEVREHLSCIQGAAIRGETRGYLVRPALERDLATCNTLAVRIHGHDRGAELQDAIAHGVARVVEREGRITGYATQIAFFGHTLGETTDDVRALITAAESYAGPGFLVPSRNGELLRWCLQNGLRIRQPMTLMTMGLYNEPAGAYLPSVLY